jgi:uncharacterized C2H2 Zn-finger protein
MVAMGKLRCRCGYVIKDQADNLPYKGRLLRDQDLDHTEQWKEDAACFLIAVYSGQREQWLAQQPAQQWFRTLSDEDIIGCIIDSYLKDRELDVFQCPRCHRMLVQQIGTQHFCSFVREDDNCENLLAVRYNNE